MTEIIVQDQLLECAICLEQLDENCKMLPCQHTYCRTCLERMYEHDGSLNCPQCRINVPNIDGGNPIDTLPTNFILLSIIEQVKRHPPRPRNETDELQAAITNSIDDFQKEKTAEMLLKHNEHLQTQLAMESSKRDVILKNAQDMSEELNELFLSQKSQDEEIFKRENQNLLSEKEKLEVEVAILKSEQENPDYINGLISWFEKNHVEWNPELKKEVQNVLKNLRRTKVTQCNDSIQRRLRTLLENLQAEKKLETPAETVEKTRENVTPRDKDVSDVSGNDDVVDIVNKKLLEVKALLKNESRSNKMNPKTEMNYSNQSRHLQTPQQPHPAFQSIYQNYYLPPPLMSVPTNSGGFMTNYYHHPYYAPPHYHPNFPPASNYPPVPNLGAVPLVPHPHPKDSRSDDDGNNHRDSFGDKSNKVSHSGPVPLIPHLHPKDSRSNAGRNAHRDSFGDKFSHPGPVPLIPPLHPKDSRSDAGRNTHRDSFGDKSGRIGHRSASSNDFKNLNKSTSMKSEEKNELKKSLILPDVRDYDELEKKMGVKFQKDGNRKQNYDKKIQEKVHQLPTTSREAPKPLLMLPDVRYYDKIYSKLTHSGRLSTSGDGQNDTESFGIGYHDEKKKSYDDSSIKPNRGKSHHGRGKNRYKYTSINTSNKDGFESDSSADSVTSVSSQLSTCSTPAVFRDKRRNFPHKGRGGNGSYNPNFQRKSHNNRPPKEKPDGNKTDNLEKVIYPSRKEALMRNLNVKKPFESILLCLGKTREGDPKSEIVQCLADIYAFEEKYTECQLIRY